MSIITSVQDKRDGRYLNMDIYSRLLEDRIIIIDSPITDDVASKVIAEILYLASKDKEGDISIYINSPGGVITAGLAIIDVMELVEPDVSTVCVGSAASMAAVILSAGEKGKRYALPRAEMILHQPYGGATGQASDIKIQAERILETRAMINEMLAVNTGQDIERINADTDRDNYLSADEAVKYGLVDKVLRKEAGRE